MHFNGTSYMAQYPTGNLFAYDKGPPKHLPNWPPKLPQVSPSAREAMSLGIYGGKMHVGVWPWAELWALNADADQWNYIARGFTHPELTDQQVHPYEKQAMAQGLVQNHWGQRITSLVPHGDALYCHLFQRLRSLDSRPRLPSQTPGRRVRLAIKAHPTR